MLLPPKLLHRASLIGALFALLLIGTATLTPTSGNGGSVGSLCLGCGSFGLTDILLNILLFAPLGIVLGRAGMRPLLIVGVGLLVSGGVEALQIFIPGRSPTARDVLTNALGCVLGGLVGLHLRSWTTPGRRAVILLWATTTGLLAAVWLTGIGMQFDPPPGVYFGQWQPDRGNLERWRGRVQEATVGAIAVPDGPSPHSAAIGASLRDSVRLRIVGTGGPPTARLGGIFALMTDDQTEGLLVGPDGHDLVVRIRRRATAWRMHGPDFRFPDALRAVMPGEPLVLEFSGDARGGCATVNGRRQCAGRPAAGSTWTFARTFSDSPWWVHRLLDMLALFCLALPAGIFLRSAPRGHAIAIGGVLALGLPASAWHSGLALPFIWEWIGIALALLAGWALHTQMHPGAE